MFVGCLTSRQHASVSQGQICSDNFTCCHAEIEVADQTFHLTQSQYTDTGPTSPSADPITPGAWQGSHRSANFSVTGMTKKSRRKRDSNPGSSVLEVDALTTRIRVGPKKKEEEDKEEGEEKEEQEGEEEEEEKEEEEKKKKKKKKEKCQRRRKGRKRR